MMIMTSTNKVISAVIMVQLQSIRSMCTKKNHRVKFPFKTNQHNLTKQLHDSSGCALPLFYCHNYTNTMTMIIPL